MSMFKVIDRPPTFGEKFGRGFGAGVGQGLAKSTELAIEAFKNRQERNRLAKTLEAHGVAPEDAKLYSTLTTGGQTEFAKSILEQKKRGGRFGGGVTRPATKLLEAEGIQETPEQKEEREIGEFLEEQDTGLTPAEKVRRQSERFKAGLPAFQEAGTKLRGFTRDKERLDMLENLNKTGKLPKGLARINVDAEGNLRLPFLASAEAQRYVKILNEFSSGAKDTFGSRVTNFDLSQFLKRFPTLLNTEEGRRQLFQQMKIVNDINSVYYKSLKDVYEKAGGVRNIDPDVAESIAERLSAPKVEKLVSKFGSIGAEESLPSAAKHKGDIYQDDETGETFVSDGKNWIKQ